jgi:Dockerin type I domain/PQQ enzyme repeat
MFGFGNGRRIRRSELPSRAGRANRRRYQSMQPMLECLEARRLLTADVLTNHNTPGSTGADLSETVLTPATVKSSQAASSITTNFGRLFDTTLDGQVYAQPLAVANVNITRGPSQGIHNVLFVATMHDSLYALDANTGTILWQDNFLQIADPRVTTTGSPVPTAGVSTIPAGVNGPNGSSENALVNSSDVGPELGILATPAIDPSTDILYLNANTQELRSGSNPTNTVSGADWHFVQRLWAINLSNGAVAITPSNISAEPASGGQVIGDTILNPRTSGSNPSFSSYNPTSFTVTSLTRSAGTATATISSTTGMRAGDSITISGATPAGYNGTFTITAVPSSTTFQFAVPGTLTSPATGTITAKWGANYKYVVGPFIKGTGNNTDTFNANGTVATTDNADSWGVNLTDTSSIFAGTTPSATGYIAFNALLQMNRVATTVINGEVYLGFASHGDDGPYYGWLLGYNAATLANNAAFVTVPTFDGIKGSAGFTSVGGLWGSGGGITTDGTYLYFTVGNGSFNTATSNFSSNYFSLDGNNHVLNPRDGDYGDSVLKVAFDPAATQTNINLANNAVGNPTPNGAYNPTGGYDINGYGLKVVDFFTPSNAKILNLHDEDIGSGGVLLIPTTGPGSATAPNGDPMLVTAGKEGRIYLIDANNMGGFNTQYVTDGREIDSTTNSAVDPAPYDRVLGEYYYVQANGSSGTYANNQTDKGYDIPSYFNGRIYVGLGASSVSTLQSPEQGFNVATFPFSSTPHTGVQPTPSFTTANNFGGRGTTATISANGVSNGIIWNILVQQSGTDALVAYDASVTGTASQIFNSNWTISGQSSNTSDTLTNGAANATGVKFSIPTVFNGMVYVGTGGGSGTGGHVQGTITGYGLLNVALTAPSGLAAQAESTSKIHLSWTRNTTSESEMVVERSLNGTTWTTLAYLPNGSTNYDDSTAVAGTQYFYRVKAISGANSSAYSNIATVNAPTYPRGDFNLDGTVNAADVPAMLVALTDLPTFQASHSLSNSDWSFLADVNGDQSINNSDLQSLLSLLASGGGSDADNSPSTAGNANEMITSPRVIWSTVSFVAPTPAPSSSGSIVLSHRVATTIGPVLDQNAGHVSKMTTTAVDHVLSSIASHRARNSHRGTDSVDDGTSLLF